MNIRPTRARVIHRLHQRGTTLWLLRGPHVVDVIRTRRLRHIDVVNITVRYEDGLTVTHGEDGKHRVLLGVGPKPQAHEAGEAA